MRIAELNLKKEITKINWLIYETAYDDTGEKTAVYLQDLLYGDKEAKLKSAHMLWCSLCHQHAYVSSAALPAYDFLLYGLENLDDYIKVDLLDIFLGFAACTRDINALNGTSWQYQLKEKLTRDIETFRNYTTHSDEDISCFSRKILQNITK